MKTVECLHCRTPFLPSENEGEFCCSGCRFVHHLLHRRGLADFYRYGETRAPVGGGVFHGAEWGWLRELQARAEGMETGEVAAAELGVQGISCAGCVWLIEAVFLEQPGAVACEVNAAAGVIRVRWLAGKLDLAGYAEDIRRFGYMVGPTGEKAGAPAMRPLVRRMGICGALALNAMLFALPRYLGLAPGEALAELFDFIALLLATASVMVGGTVFFRRALGALRRGDLHIDLPISIGIAVAYAGSVLAWRLGDGSFAYFDFVSIFTFLMLLGRWLQERAVETNRRRLLGLRLAPGRITILRDGIEREEDAISLAAGDRYSVARGALVPVRSRLMETGGLFALDWINGEPAPREFPPGSQIPSGARNLSAEALDLVANECWGESALSRLIAFDAGRPWKNTGLRTFIRSYLVAVLALAAAGFAFWAATGGWLAAFQVLVSVLVVSCPCAIGVALPLLDDAVAAALRPHGIYVREHTLWSRLRKVRALLFDKTGTITLERPVLANPDAINKLDTRNRGVLLRMVWDSLHPVAGCLRETLLAGGVEPAAAEPEEIMETTGIGIEWASREGRFRLGRAWWAEGLDGAAGKEDGGTVFSLNGGRMAEFFIREEIRPGAREQISGFMKRGFEVYLLSGDAPGRVEAMALSLGLPGDHGIGGLTPGDKAELVRERWAECSLMLGDGANDAPAFDAALCRGTPAVEQGLLEHKADFYILGRSLAGVGELFDMAEKRSRSAGAVLIFAIGYNAAAVSAALAGWMNPLVAAAIMPLSSLVSIFLVLLFLRSGTGARKPGAASHHLKGP